MGVDGLIARAMIAFLVPSLAVAQTLAPANANESASLRVPAGTIVEFAITDHVNSKLSKIGDSFRFRLTEPVLVGGAIALQKDAIGVGEVIHAARARAGGKAGELILAARYIEHEDGRVPLRAFRFGRSGENNTGQGIALAFVGGPLAYLVVGGEVDAPPGTYGFARVASDTDLRAAQQQ